MERLGGKPVPGPTPAVKKRAGWAPLLFAVASCIPVGLPPEGGPGEPVPAVRSELTLAREALAAGLPDSARTVLTRLLDTDPAAADSGAYLLLGEVELALGDPSAALRSGQRHLQSSSPGSESALLGTIVIGTAHFLLGDVAAGGESLFSIPQGASEAVRSRVYDAGRDISSTLDSDQLVVVYSTFGDRSPFVIPFLTALAETQVAAGRTSDARALAERVLASSPPAEDADRSRALLAELGPEPEEITVGVLLSPGGSPTYQRLSAGILEGVQVAAARFERETGVPVRLLNRDDRGDPRTAGQLVPGLERAGVVGIVGPVGDALVAAAAARRGGPTPIVSPTARGVGAEGGGAFSVVGLDPGPSEELARYVAGEEYRRVVVFHPGTHVSRFETGAFQRAFRSAGGELLSEVVYDSTATFFQDPMREVSALAPDAVVFPLLPEEVELVAPQFTFFGLDSLGIQVFGTTGWTDAGVQERVDPRHLEGVIAVTPETGLVGNQGRDEFISEYESYFRRSLRSDLPELGYDAASLLLRSTRGGRSSPASASRELAGGFTLPGATGRLFVEDGRVTRSHRVVLFDEGRMVPVVPLLQDSPRRR